MPILLSFFLLILEGCASLFIDTNNNFTSRSESPTKFSTISSWGYEEPTGPYHFALSLPDKTIIGKISSQGYDDMTDSFSYKEDSLNPGFSFFIHASFEKIPRILFDEDCYDSSTYHILQTWQLTDFELNKVETDCSKRLIYLFIFSDERTLAIEIDSSNEKIPNEQNIALIEQIFLNAKLSKRGIES